MVGQFYKVVQAPGFYLRAALCIFIPAAVGRALEVLETSMSNAESAYPALLLFVHWASLALLCVSTAAALTLIAAAIYTGGPKCAARVMGLFALCSFAAAAAQFFIDGATGEGAAARSDYDAILSIVSYISEIIVAVAIAFGVWIVSAAFYRVYKAHHGGRNYYSLKSSVNAAILLNFAVPFVRLIVRGAASLVAVNWRPSVTEIRSLVYEGVEIFVFYAIIAFIGSRITLSACTRREFYGN